MQEPHIPLVYTFHQPTQATHATIHTPLPPTYVTTTRSGQRVHLPKKLCKTVYVLTMLMDIELFLLLSFISILFIIFFPLAQCRQFCRVDILFPSAKYLLLDFLSTAGLGKFCLVYFLYRLVAERTSYVWRVNYFDRWSRHIISPNGDNEYHLARMTFPGISNSVKARQTTSSSAIFKQDGHISFRSFTSSNSPPWG